MFEIMDEKRRDRRVEDYADITMSVISNAEDLQQKNIFHNCSEDISLSGVRIYANNFFPVNSLLKMEIKFDNTRQMITTTGRIKWFKEIFEDEWYEGGVEFVVPSNEAIKKLSGHIYALLRLNSEDFYYS
jgi:hypothetical protein